MPNYKSAYNREHERAERLETEKERLRSALDGLLAAYAAEFGDPLRHSGPITDAAMIAHDLLAECPS